MAKPIIKTINTFDATKGTTVNFIWSGNMAYNNRLVLYDAEKLLVVYDNTYSVNHFTLMHEVPANVLVNGKKYAAEIYVIDRTGQMSEPSDKLFFWTNSSAQFYFDGLDKVEENLVENSSFTAVLQYFQSDSVPIATYQYFLYNSMKELLDSSAVYQNPRKMSYTFRSLENMTRYYIRATGTNSRNMPLDTGYVLLNVRYAEPSTYGQIYADVNETVGTVDYYTNIVQVESERPSKTYFYEEGWVDLTKLNANRSMEIVATGNVQPELVAYYKKIDGTNSYEIAKGRVVIKDYSEIQEIGILGAYYQPVPKSMYSYLTNCSIMIDKIKILDILNGSYLMATPVSKDILSISNSGAGIIHHNVGEMIINGNYSGDIGFLEHITHGPGVRRVYAYSFFFDIGIKMSEATDIVCDRFLVTDPSEEELPDMSSFVRISKRYSDEPRLELFLNSRIYDVRTMDILDFLADNPFRIMYPLITPIIERTEVYKVPSFENVDNIIYSSGFTIPFENATFSIRMRNAFRSGEILRAQREYDASFVLESIIQDDGYLRYKLTADDMVIYSEPYKFRDWDIVTIHVRRVSGLYGLYVFIQEEEQEGLRNMWFISTEPEGSTEESDIWLDKDYPTTYIDKDTVVRFYQDEEPTGASEQNIWIGNNEI